MREKHHKSIEVWFNEVTYSSPQEFILESFHYEDESFGQALPSNLLLQVLEFYKW